MAFGHKPEIWELPKRLKLVKPAGVPMGDNISPDLKNIYSLALNKELSMLKSK